MVGVGDVQFAGVREKILTRAGGVVQVQLVGARLEHDGIGRRAGVVVGVDDGVAEADGLIGVAEGSKLSVKLVGVKTAIKVRSSSRSSVASVARRCAGRRWCCGGVDRVRFQGQGRRSWGVMRSLLERVGAAQIAAIFCV